MGDRGTLSRFKHLDAARGRHGRVGLFSLWLDGSACLVWPPRPVIPTEAGELRLILIDKYQYALFDLALECMDRYGDPSPDSFQVG